MAKRTSTSRDPRRQRQKIGGAPIVEDSKLPRMGEAPSPIDGPRPRATMPADPGADTGVRRRMGEVRLPKPKRPARRSVGEFGDQVARTTRSLGGDAGAAAGPGYLRLRVLVEDGELSIGGAKVVEGPLAAPAALHPGVAYEVTVDGRRVAEGQVLDAGVNRSYPDPSGRPATSGHHITVARRFEIAVRVPLDDVSPAALSRAQVVLYRWRGQPTPVEGTASMRRSLGRQVETIGRLKGIRLAALPKSVQAKLRRR